jgi:hypothetical protein
MPWNVSWADEQETIILLQPEEPLNWEELREAIHQYHTLAESKEHEVDVIYALYRDLKLPSANLLPHVREYLLTSPPNRGTIMFVDAPSFIKRIVDITTKVHGSADKISNADSVEEAISRLIDMRHA